MARNRRPRHPIDQHVTFVYSDNLENAARFYGDILALPLVLDQGACRIFRVAADSFLGICRASKVRPAEPRGVILTFVTDELAAWHGTLVAAGAAVDGEPRLNSQYQIEHFFASDPDGRQIEFQKFLSPRWPKPASK